ncbi:hypothetical protein R5W24_006330, partial [Gemmata sp. JC717]|uniref:hypothetical protein n=1 Tax=Gemmata algarum TaxID=2975278 RepID=UPI0021BACB7F
AVPRAVRLRVHPLPGALIDVALKVGVADERGDWLLTEEAGQVVEVSTDPVEGGPLEFTLLRAEVRLPHFA